MFFSSLFYIKKLFSGANKGEFSFQVTDGFNNDKLRTFQIEVCTIIFLRLWTDRLNANSKDPPKRSLAVWKLGVITVNSVGFICFIHGIKQ